MPVRGIDQLSEEVYKISLFNLLITNKAHVIFPAFGNVEDCPKRIFMGNKFL